MQIHVEKSSNKIKDEEVKSLIDSSLSFLLNKRTYDCLSIHIEFKNMKLGFYGVTEWMDSNLRPREFKITINKKYCRSRQLNTIGHELIHVKQYVKNELKELFRPCPKLLWKGKPVHFEEEYNSKYLMQPFEIEARGWEEALVQRWEEEYGKS